MTTTRNVLLARQQALAFLRDAEVDLDQAQAEMRAAGLEGYHSHIRRR